MKSGGLHSVKKYLKVFMFVEAGSFVGRALQIYTRYKKHPEYYAFTGPWYIDVLHWGVVTGIIIVVSALVYWFVCYKIKSMEAESKV